MKTYTPLLTEGTKARVGGGGHLQGVRQEGLLGSSGAALGL